MSLAVCQPGHRVSIVKAKFSGVRNTDQSAVDNAGLECILRTQVLEFLGTFVPGLIHTIKRFPYGVR